LPYVVGCRGRADLDARHGSTGSRIELEGNTLPITHSKDVLEVLKESAEQPTG
jgi:hypothetical protein